MSLTPKLLSEDRADNFIQDLQKRIKLLELAIKTNSFTLECLDQVPLIKAQLEFNSIVLKKEEPKPKHD